MTEFEAVATTARSVTWTGLVGVLAIAMDNAWVSVLPPLVTSTSKFVVPAAVGVPLIRPVPAFSNRPSGRVVPLKRAHP